MNLEDFKSFCRVLIPSEVGSIPTHSRHSLAGFVVVFVLAAAPVARASEDLSEMRPSPFGRAVRSAVLPGWGQVANGKSTKAMVLLSFQSYLYGRIILETREARESDRQADRLRAMDGEDPVVAGLLLRAENSAQDHYDTRRDLIFWSILGAFYSAIDAYIDAHIGEMDEELEEGRELFGRLDPVEGSVELGVRF